MAKNIENKLKDYLFNTEKSIQEVLFVPKTPHPLWDDNLKVLQLANQQIVQPSGAFPKEHIYAFIGVHARTKITGKRDSIGFPQEFGISKLEIVFISAQSVCVN